MLSLSHISFSYGLVQILDDVSIEVPKAKVVCVMGRNGVGKTTLMRNIVGLEKASKGTVTLDGRDITKTPARKRAQSGLALVPQGRMIFPRLSVKENLEVGLSARTDGRRSIPQEIYDLFPVLSDMGARQGGNLSGGQQQQLAIGRALVGEPRVLLLDEPTEGIQPNVIQAIGQVLRRLVSEKEMTVVLVEQYVDFIKEFGDHFYIMNRGRVVADGDRPQLSEAIVRQHLSV